MTHSQSTAAERMPRGVDLLSLQVWAEWRRRRVPVRELARRAGYHPDTVDKFLRGENVWHRQRVARDLWEALHDQRLSAAQRSATIQTLGATGWELPADSRKATDWSLRSGGQSIAPSNKCERGSPGRGHPALTTNAMEPRDG